MAYTKMATFVNLPSGSWRAIIRRKGRYISETFKLREDARRWATAQESAIDRGAAPKKTYVANKTSLAHLIDLHISDFKDAAKPIGRTKLEALLHLRRTIGHKRYADLDRKFIIDFGRERARGGAGPVTIGMDIGWIKLVLAHASAVHEIETRIEPIEMGRLALKHLGLIGKSQERDRRPTEEELERIFKAFDKNPWQKNPMTRIIQFAIGTAMRQDEICRITWNDLDTRARTIIIRDRKDPRDKRGNDQRIPLVNITGYDPLALIEEQRAIRTNFDDRIFPYTSIAISAAFTRTVAKLKIDDLHFHDMRHEATSRLFEAGLQIEQVALITGHKDWKMLRRYTHIKAKSVHAAAAQLKPWTDPED
jgi:integrase